MKYNYIALTLGPITRINDMAKSTKELWAASYLFSYLGKELIKPFKEREFLLPLINENEKWIWEPQMGAGLFPDRYIFKSEVGDFGQMKNTSEYVLRSLVNNMACSVSAIKFDKEKAYSYLKSSLKIYFFEKEFSEYSHKREIVKECERYMNLIEMQDTFPERVDDKKEYLSLFLENVNGNWVRKGDEYSFKRSFLSEDAYGKNYNNRLFESTLEISAAGQPDFIESYTSIQDDFQKKVITELHFKNQENLLTKQLRPYQKYIAIVKSDGDSFGEAASTVEWSNSVNPLSEALLKFNLEAAKLINAYKGKPVFIGGDDLLFFAPVYFEGKNIFGLIKDIDGKFNEIFKEVIPDKPPTISFSVSVTYYKYPMFEALSKADNLLFNKAKKNAILNIATNEHVELDRIKKNNLVFSIQKHSGQVIEAIIHKSCSNTFEKATNMVNTYILKKRGKVSDSDKADNNESDQDKFLASVMHKLQLYRPMFEVLFIQENEREARELLLGNFFANNFNEPEHNSCENILKYTQQLILEAYCELEALIANVKYTADMKKDMQKSFVCKAVNLTYAILRFIHFVNSDRNE